MNQGLNGFPPGARPQTALSLIESVVLANPLPSVTFRDIPGQFGALLLHWQTRSDAAVTDQSSWMRFNGDAGANYDWQNHYAAAATFHGIEGAVGAIQGRCGACTGASAPAGRACSGQLLIPNYAGATFHKVVQYTAALPRAATTGDTLLLTGMTNWRSTNPIREMQIFPNAGNFIAGCLFTLYGMDG